MVQHAETLAAIYENRDLLALSHDLKKVAEAHRGKVPEILEGVTVFDARASIFQHSKFSHHREDSTVVVEGVRKSLTPTENMLLIALENNPRPRHADELVKEVIGGGYVEANIRTHISNLRKKIRG